MLLNRVFPGSRRTGKTTVTKLYGQIHTELGLWVTAKVILYIRIIVCLLIVISGRQESS